MGKSFTVLAAGSGQILLALAIVAVGYLQHFTPLERKAYDNVQQDSAHQKKIELAVRWIQTAYRYRLYMKMNHHPQKFKQLIYINEMRSCARDFQKHRFKMFQMQQDVPKEQLLASLNAQVGGCFEEVLRDSRGIEETKIKVKKAEDNQKEIERLLREISGLGEMVDRKLE